MSEAGLVLVVGGMLVLTVVVVGAAPRRGPLMLGLLALGIASACFIGAYRIGFSTYLDEAARFAVLTVVGAAHLVVGIVLLGVWAFNRRHRYA